MFRLWLFGVLLSCCLCCLVTPRFLCHLLSHTGDWQSKQNVLMTVIASSARGNGKKKSTLATIFVLAFFVAGPVFRHSALASAEDV